jgi:hypothetical protein
VEVTCPAVQVANDEVPVARMRGKGYDALFRHWLSHGFREMKPAEEKPIAKRMKRLHLFFIFLLFKFLNFLIFFKGSVSGR